ncbi:hypothetical protein F4801DRAFT_576560 [Xylaria longipes]|nr:hypothetical protein F4801DRAFT_576560 [Xylaria longipes]
MLLPPLCGWGIWGWLADTTLAEPTAEPIRRTAVKAKGTVVNVAIWEKEIAFNPNWVTWKESTYRSVLGYRKQDFEAVIENLRTGAIKPNGMITARIKFENVVQDGIKRLISDKDNHVKILVDINAK